MEIVDSPRTNGCSVVKHLVWPFKESPCEAVRRGAELLDTRLPGWADQINLDTLRLENGCACVLGQLGQIQVNLDRLSWHGEGPAFYRGMVNALRLNRPSSYGFNVPPELEETGDPLRERFSELQDAWKGEIVARRTL